jgi:hypothetical protein
VQPVVKSKASVDRVKNANDEFLLEHMKIIRKQQADMGLSMPWNNFSMEDLVFRETEPLVSSHADTVMGRVENSRTSILKDKGGVSTLTSQTRSEALGSSILEKECNAQPSKSIISY